MRNYDQAIQNLWKWFMLLLNGVVFIVVLSSTYILLKDKIDPLFEAPRYSKEQLAEFAKKAEQRSIQADKDDWDKIKNGIHVNTGLKADKDLQLIISSCTSCHSAKLITQNRATRLGWSDMIDWMQETQGLQDLGSSEPLILNYLAKHYSPKKVGRRANLNLAEIEWYILNLDEKVTE